jgi:preprotein translocase subunit YajC
MASNTVETRRGRDRQRAADRQAEARRSPPLEAAPLRGRPANENDPGSSLMLARLNRQPSYTAYYVAFVLSLAWIFGWSMLYSATLFNQPTDETVRSFALLVLPIGIMWVMAYFLWRAQQLRQVSEVLMQSAMRLIRPQDIATEGLTSIAQAVRSEVDLLVGGVEHAVQRATVLEEIVHKEI